jgi:hypothetical protein
MRARRPKDSFTLRRQFGEAITLQQKLRSQLCLFFSTVIILAWKIGGQGGKEKLTLPRSNLLRLGRFR